MKLYLWTEHVKTIDKKLNIWVPCFNKLDIESHKTIIFKWPIFND